MAVRREDLDGENAVIYAFPLARVAASRRDTRRRVRRRRTIGIATVLLALALLLGGPGGSAAADGPARAPRTVVVQAGDTLWGIAERFAPEGTDPRAYVDAMIALNDLDGGLPAGERLELPR
jgi:hypothetical protein